MDLIREETALMCRTNGSLDRDYLLSNCPRLDALWNEALRVYSNIAVFRDVVTPFTLGGKNLHCGDSILSPFRHFNLDTSVFGEYPLEFHAERFLERKALTKAKTWRPFGGGATYCPGRFVARQEVYAFVALAIHRFHLTVDPATHAQPFPMPDRKRPSLGAISPIPGSDLIVNVTRRCES
jgi:cytochrome P450